MSSRSGGGNVLRAGWRRALLPERGVPRSGPRLGQSRHVNTTTGAAEEPGAALELLRVSGCGAAARRERKAGERGGRRARTDRRREAAREPRRRRGGPAGGQGRPACGSARDLDGPRSAGTGQTCPPPAAYRPPLIGRPAAGPCWRHRSRPAPRGGCSNVLAFLSSSSSLCRISERSGPGWRGSGRHRAAGQHPCQVQALCASLPLPS